VRGRQAGFAGRGAVLKQILVWDTLSMELSVWLKQSYMRLLHSQTFSA